MIFSVGNNRFIDQADFAPPFSEHVNLTMEKSVFFGLRNTGSMETIKPYIAEPTATGSSTSPARRPSRPTCSPT